MMNPRLKKNQNSNDYFTFLRYNRRSKMPASEIGYKKKKGINFELGRTVGNLYHQLDMGIPMLKSERVFERLVEFKYGLSAAKKSKRDSLDSSQSSESTEKGSAMAFHNKSISRLRSKAMSQPNLRRPRSFKAGSHSDKMKLEVNFWKFWRRGGRLNPKNVKEAQQLVKEFDSIPQKYDENERFTRKILSANTVFNRSAFKKNELKKAKKLLKKKKQKNKFFKKIGDNGFAFDPKLLETLEKGGERFKKKREKLQKMRIQDLTQKMHMGIAKHMISVVREKAMEAEENKSRVENEKYFIQEKVQEDEKEVEMFVGNRTRTLIKRDYDDIFNSFQESNIAEKHGFILNSDGALAFPDELKSLGKFVIQIIDMKKKKIFKCHIKILKDWFMLPNKISVPYLSQIIQKFTKTTESRNVILVVIKIPTRTKGQFRVAHKFVNIGSAYIYKRNKIIDSIVGDYVIDMCHLLKQKDLKYRELEDYKLRNVDSSFHPFLKIYPPMIEILRSSVSIEFDKHTCECVKISDMIEKISKALRKLVRHETSTHSGITHQTKELEMIKNLSYAEQNFIMINLHSEIKGSKNRGLKSRINKEFKRHRERPLSGTNYSKNNNMKKDMAILHRNKVINDIPFKLQPKNPAERRNFFIKKNLRDLDVIQEKRVQKIKRANEDQMLEEVRIRREKEKKRKEILARGIKLKKSFTQPKFSRNKINRALKYHNKFISQKRIPVLIEYNLDEDSSSGDEQYSASNSGSISSVSSPGNKTLLQNIA